MPNLFRARPGVALLHFGRAGSTLVASLIRQNRGVFYDGELYERVRVGQVSIDDDIRHDPSLLLNLRRKRRPFQQYLVSLKPIPEEHLRAELLNSDFETLINNLVNYGFGHFVILSRSNYVSQMVSLALARKWDKYHFLAGEEPDRVQVDIPFNRFRFGTFEGELSELFERFDGYYKTFKALVPNPLILSYEDDIENDPMLAYVKLAEYLGLKKVAPRVALRKSNVFRNRDIISNYDELREYLADTKYAWMI